MKLNSDQIDYLSFRIARHLRDSKSVEMEDLDTTHHLISRAISADLAVEDKLNDEVREMLESYEDTMRREGAQFHEMFKKVKAKLVRERRLIL